MKRDIRSIRKQFRLTETEEKQILDLMREKGEDNRQLLLLVPYENDPSDSPHSIDHLSLF